MFLLKNCSWLSLWHKNRTEDKKPRQIKELQSKHWDCFAKQCPVFCSKIFWSLRSKHDKSSFFGWNFDSPAKIVDFLKKIRSFYNVALSGIFFFGLNRWKIECVNGHSFMLKCCFSIFMCKILFCILSEIFEFAK